MENERAVPQINEKSRKIVRFCLILSAVFLILSALLIVYCSFFSHGFHKDGKGIYYSSGLFGERKTGLLSVDGQNYLIAESGYVEPGLVSYRGEYFYVSEEGKVVSGILTLSGKRMCFDSDFGTMLRSSFYTLPNSNPSETYYFDETGASVTGSRVIDGNTYLFAENGCMVRGFVKISGHLYYFDEDGKMATGFMSVGSDFYDFGTDGAALSEFQLIDGKIYYFLPDSFRMLTGFLDDGEDGAVLFGDDGARGNGLTVYLGSYYLTDSFGTPLSGWVEKDRNTYYCNYDGELAMGWVTLDGKLRYFDENGLAFGFRAVGEEVYYFDEEGTPLTGEQTLFGKNYLFGEDGVFRTGFVSDDDVKYYFDDYGYPVTGDREINGYLYSFREDGTMICGEWNGLRYFANDGTACEGFKTVDGKKYYFDESHNAITGFLKIEGFTYYFDGLNGAATGKITVDGVEYEFAANGILASEIAKQ